MKLFTIKGFGFKLKRKNTKIFHRSLLHKQVRNMIHWLTDETGSRVHDQQGLGQLVVCYFQGLLSAHSTITIEDISRYFSSKIARDSVPLLEPHITNDEIKESLFSILDDKALIPYGYTSLLFKRN